ncbi:hypothetical protein DPV78_011076 [Talaromyces pinophilus]|nr:hypothetical protein DPV78_011076 [Talaromyces pinophilus]
MSDSTFGFNSDLKTSLFLNLGTFKHAPWSGKGQKMEPSTDYIATELKSRLTQSPKKPLEFISISNPDEIRNRGNQQKIKRHAAQIRSKGGSKRRHLVSQVFEIASPQSEAINNLPPGCTAIPIQNWTDDVNGQQIQALILSWQGFLHIGETAVELQESFGPLATLILVNSPVGASVDSNNAFTIESGDKNDISKTSIGKKLIDDSSV